MRAALAADPDHHAATGNLGALMRLTGEAEAAEHLLADLIRRDPGAAEARVNLAAQLLQEERTAEALAWLDAPLPPEPRLRQHWQLQHALALLQIDRPAEARVLLDTIGEVPAAVRPLLLWRRILLALAEGDQTHAEALATELEAAMAKGENILPEHRIMANYDLAKFWSRVGSPARAFPYWQRGHDLLRRSQPFSRAAYRAFADASIARLDHARLHDGPRAENADPAPVFIVGMPRSGTTLCEQILAAHTSVFGAGERAALGNVVTALGRGWETPNAVAGIAALDAASVDAAASAYLAELHALAPGAGRIVDKMPGNFRYLGLIALLLPGARIIHCQRDPRDIGLSIFTFRFYGTHAYAHDLGDLG
jgi:tetratricopeptide (TPR) repeat protein